MRKVWAFLVVLMLLCSLNVSALVIVTSGPPAASSSLLSMDFEGAETWDATSTGATYDCTNNYDTDGDYCDDDTTTYYGGSEALGIRDREEWVRKNLSSSSKHVIYEFWFRMNTNSYYKRLIAPTNSGGNAIAYIRNTNSGYMQITDDAFNSKCLGTTAMAANTWYHVKVRLKFETTLSDNDGEAEIWVSTGSFGASEVSCSSIDYGTYGADATTAAEFHGNYPGWVQWFDDISITDNT